MTVAQHAARQTDPTKVRTDSIFFPAMALAMAAVVFTGFAPSWFLRGYIQPSYPLEPLSPLLIIHGTAFTLWVVLFIAQTSLVAANRRRWTSKRQLQLRHQSRAGKMLVPE